MIRFRSSSRCSRKLIAGMVSEADFWEGSSAVISGIGNPCHGRLLSLTGRRRPSSRRQRLYRVLGLFRRWQRALLLLPFEMRNLRFDLALELIRSPSQLIQYLAHLPRDLRQLLRPKNQQGQKEKKDGLRKPHGSHDTARRGNQQRGLVEPGCPAPCRCCKGRVHGSPILAGALSPLERYYTHRPGPDNFQ